MIDGELVGFDECCCFGILLVVREVVIEYWWFEVGDVWVFVLWFLCYGERERKMRESL